MYIKQILSSFEENMSYMETITKKNFEDKDMDVEFSYSIKAGKRIYYMDVRRTRKEDLYLSITESKKLPSTEGDNAAPTFEKHKIFLYKEDFSKFIEGLSKAIGYIHEHQTVYQPSSTGKEHSPEQSRRPDTEKSENTPKEDTFDNLKIDF